MPENNQKVARERYIEQLSLKMKELLPNVLHATGYHSEGSLHGKLGSKNRDFMDIAHEVIYAPDQFISLWLVGFKKYVEQCSPISAYRELFEMLRACYEL